MGWCRQFLSLLDILTEVTTTLAAICIALFTWLKTTTIEKPPIKIRDISRKGFYAGILFLISSLSIVFQLLISSGCIKFIQLDENIIIGIISVLEVSTWLFFMLGVIYLIWVLKLIYQYL